MVRRVLINEVKSVIKCVAEKVMPELTYWAPMNPEVLAQSWENLCRNDDCRVYALESSGAPVGMFLGMMVPDMNSGLMQGLEFLWVVAKPFRNRAVGLLKRFEADCKDRGCKIVITGASNSMAPARMFSLYQHLGYEPHATVYSKRL